MAKKVKLENELLRSLAEDFNSIFVDAANLIPQKDEYFVDCVHFSPKGMEMIAKCFGDAVMSDLAAKSNCRKELLIHK